MIFKPDFTFPLRIDVLYLFYKQMRRNSLNFKRFFLINFANFNLTNKNDGQKTLEKEMRDELLKIYLYSKELLK